MGRPVDKSNPRVGTAGIRYHKNWSGDDITLLTAELPESQLNSSREILGSNIAGPKTLVTIPYKWRDLSTGRTHSAKTTAFIPDVSDLAQHSAPGYPEPWVILKDGTTYMRTDLRADEDGFRILLERTRRNQPGIYDPKAYESTAYDEEEADDEVASRWLMAGRGQHQVVTGDGHLWTKVTRH